MADGALTPTAETSQPSPSNAEAGVSSQSQEIEKPSGKTSARDDVLAAMAEIDAKAEKAAKPIEGDAKAAVKAEPAKTGEPQRGPDGKFIKAEAQTQQQPADPKAAQQPKPVTAPASWKGSQKVDFNRLPREVQEGIAAEFQRYGDVETKWNALNAVLGPREAALVAQYGGVDRALTQLFALSDYAARDPMGFTNWFLASRGINLQQLVSTPSNAGQQPTGQQAPDGAASAGIDPALRPLADRLNGIERFLTQQQQADQQATARHATSEVQAFIANSEKYPYANDVRKEMHDLFMAGQAKTLDEAYGMAVRMNSTISERMTQDRINAELEKRAAAAAEKKIASVSVSGSPGGQLAAPKGGRRNSVRDDVLAAANEIGFGGVARL